MLARALGLCSVEDKQFLIELTETLKKCPKHNLYLIGDFNFDLLTLASEDSKKFEELITSYGLFPLISKVTHTRPNCRGTCIDNILTTEPINVNLTGIIEQSLSHHSSVFAISKLSHSYAKKEAKKEGKRNSLLKPKFIIDNQHITNRRVIANEFNIYFVSLASKLNDPDDHCIINIEPIQPFTAFLKQSNISSIYLSECTSYEISELISGLENSKASDIPIKIIKRSSHIISPLLASHFNESMSRGIFPDILKVGKITPIYKKDNPELLENYRPVSTLPIFGKIFKK